MSEIRPIDANALRDCAFEVYQGNGVELETIMVVPLVEINNAPTVEVGYLTKRLKGKWITRHKQNSFGQDIVCFECNKCGKFTLPIIYTMITEPLGVCPNCGADMRGEEK